MQDEINGLDGNSGQEENLNGSILKVDFGYPEEFCNLHNNYLIASE